MYCGVLAEEVVLLMPAKYGVDIARQDSEAKAKTPTRHFEADTPAIDSREKAILPSMQQTMKLLNIHPNGSSLSV